MTDEVFPGSHCPTCGSRGPCEHDDEVDPVAPAVELAPCDVCGAAPEWRYVEALQSFEIHVEHECDCDASESAINGGEYFPDYERMAALWNGRVKHIAQLERTVIEFGRAWSVERARASKLEDRRPPGLPWTRVTAGLPNDGDVVLCIVRFDDRPTTGFVDDSGAWYEATRGDGWGWSRGHSIDVTDWCAIDRPPVAPVRELSLSSPQLHNWSVNRGSR